MNIEKCIEFVSDKVNEFLIGAQKEAISSMLEDENFSNRYFSAPASAKKDHHSAFDGGLVVHSINVAKRMVSIESNLKMGCKSSSMILVGLFHDIGKIGSFDGEPYYVKETSDWHINNLGRLYKYNENLEDGLTHAQRSIRLLHKYGVPLDDEEYIAILGHDGQYVPENQINAMKYCKSNLLRLAHMADAHSCFVDKI